MALKVASAWFNQPACIGAQNLTSINAERDKRYDMELVPQGLLVRVAGFKRPFLVGNTNLRSLEMYEDSAQSTPTAQPPPPVDNEHVAPGTGKFTPETIASAAARKPPKKAS